MFFKRRRPLRSQNFFHNRQLVKNLVRKASFGKKDTVLEIGPGKGIITQELLHVCQKVIAVEIDSKLYQLLGQRFHSHPKLTLFNADFLSFPLPSFDYQVFTNTPFSIEGKITRKLLDAKNLPQKAFLVTHKETGQRWVGHPKESYFSIRYKPWFQMSVVHRFKRSDFVPKPSVDAILISLIKRDKPLLKKSEQKNYLRFIKQGFGGGRRINQNLRPVFPKQKLKKLGRELGFSCHAKPTDLSFSRWLKLFKLWNQTLL